MSKKFKENLKKILGIVFAVFVVLLTIRFIKQLPPVVKIITLGANIATIYLVWDLIKNKKQKKDGSKKNG